MIPSSNEVRVEISTKCNYNCIICARDSLVRTKEIMSTERFEYYVKKYCMKPVNMTHLHFQDLGNRCLIEIS